MYLKKPKRFSAKANMYTLTLITKHQIEPEIKVICSHCAERLNIWTGWIAQFYRGWRRMCATFHGNNKLCKYLSLEW